MLLQEEFRFFDKKFTKWFSRRRCLYVWPHLAAGFHQCCNRHKDCQHTTHCPPLLSTDKLRQPSVKSTQVTRNLSRLNYRILSHRTWIRISYIFLKKWVKRMFESNSNQKCHCFITKYVGITSVWNYWAITPFWRMMFPYRAVSPVWTITKLSLACL